MDNETSAHILVRQLVVDGITRGFGFPGETTLPLYAAFEALPFNHTLARCERCAGYMADAYARLTNQVALCDAPGGIGSPFLLPALHEAFNSSIPLIALTTSTSDSDLGRWSTSQCDHVGMFAPVVKETISIRSLGRVSELTHRAKVVATSGRPGPVHLDISSEILASKNTQTMQNGGYLSGMGCTFPVHRPIPSPEEISQAVDLLVKSQRPLVVAGGGVLLSTAVNELAQLAELYRVPVGTTYNGKGSIPESHSSAIGTIGSKGLTSANELAKEADVCLWLGSKAGDKSTEYGTIPSGCAQTIQVDIDPAELGRTLRVDVGLCGDVGATLRALSQALQVAGWSGTSTEWQDHCREITDGNRSAIKKITAGRSHLNTLSLMAQLQECITPDAIVVADASRACGWVGSRITPHSLVVAQFLLLAEAGSIGFALPAVIAASLAFPQRHVIGIGGDGGFAMACHELETAARVGAKFYLHNFEQQFIGITEPSCRRKHEQAKSIASFYTYRIGPL